MGRLSGVDKNRRAVVGWLVTAAGVAAAMPRLVRAGVIGGQAPMVLHADASGQTDVTAAVQHAIAAAAAARVPLSVPSGRYRIDPDVGISLPSGSSLTLASDAFLVASASRRSRYALVRVYGANAVSITGGNIVGDRSIHLGQGGEWGFGVDVRGSRDVTVTNLSVSDCWGDGVYIGEGINDKAPCSDITLDHVVSTNNRRQGLSIVACRGAKVLDSIFTHTHGTAPEAGIDLEPDGAEAVTNILVRGCTMEGNAGAGLQTANHVQNVTIDHCTIRGNQRHALMFLGKTTGIIVENTVMSGNRGSCVLVGHDSAMPGMHGNTMSPVAGQQLIQLQQ